MAEMEVLKEDNFHRRRQVELLQVQVDYLRTEFHHRFNTGELSDNFINTRSDLHG